MEQNHLAIRVSDYRLSYSMKDLLKGMVTGAMHSSMDRFSVVTAEALLDRGLLDANYRPSDLGRKVAAALIAKQPKQYSEPPVARLIAGLKILQLYEPYTTPYQTGRSRRCIEVQEEAFDSIELNHRIELEDLGWKQTGVFMWVF